MIKVTIVGVGLIGASLALCLKQQENIIITGYDLQTIDLDKALQLEVIDIVSPCLVAAVTDADFIFLCVPVGYMKDIITQLSGIVLKKGCIISDVGSTKQNVVHWSRMLSDQPVFFIGGHPMAGSHKSGVEAASRILFENAFYILTPSEEVPENEVLKLEQLLIPTKAKIIHLHSSHHDRVVGAISHLPHLVAAILVNQIGKYSEDDEIYSNLAAGGFRDITRIASSNPAMWRDILLSNRDVLMELVHDWKQWIQRLEHLIDVQDGEEIEEFFLKAKKFRNQLPERRRGAISNVFDLFVDVPDHPGIIATITAILANHNINISNIHILESREDSFGALRISLRNDFDMSYAYQLLKQEGFRTSLPG